MTDVESEPREVESYELILPPGWVQHPVRPGIAAKLYEHVRAVLEPTGSHELMNQLRTSIFRAMRDLRENGGIDVILPEAKPRGLAIPAALISMTVEFGDQDLASALTLLTSGRKVDELDLFTGTAYRWRAQTVGKDTLAGVDADTEYCLMLLPGDPPTKGVLFTFNVLNTEEVPEEYLRILVMIFDAMMESVVWRYRD